MWPPMFNPLINPTTSPKLVSGIAQARIITDYKEPSDEDKDYFEKNTTLRCHELFVQKIHTMNKGEDHRQLKMLIDHLLIDMLYLLVTVVITTITSSS